MLDTLKTALKATGYSFEHYGWSKAPSGDYGVYSEDGANDMQADDIHAEKAVEGTVDYFTRDDTGTPKEAIETALEAAGVAWYLESVQFEEETGYIHFEWVFQSTEVTPDVKPEPEAVTT